MKIFFILYFYLYSLCNKVKIQLFMAMLAYIEAKQTQGKKII